MSTAADQTTEPLTLTAYAVGAEHSERPAPSDRKWMDETHQHFANRCLPMLMANQSGWWLISKIDLSAIWNGGQAKESVSINAPNVPSAHLPAVSIFGHGILTWHIPYLFRTPPGFNLLARGPANWPRENAFALEGLVETDWAVATFTMNYKILKPNVPVHFRAGEPVCMIVPQRRAELEAFHPFIRAIDDAPDTRDGYRRWAASRGEFLQSLASRPKHPTPGNLWQKHYFRGTAPDGTTGGIHETKRDLGEFERDGGPTCSPQLSMGAAAGTAAKQLGLHLSYVICTTPRSGSTLLAEALASTGVAGKPDEFFDVHEEIEALIRKRFVAEKAPIGEYLLKVQQLTKTDNGVFGWKAHWHQFDHFWRSFLGVPLSDARISRALLAEIFPNLRYIWLRRRDRLRQAISYAKAIQTDLWRTYVGGPQKPKAEPVFDKAGIDTRIDEIDRMESSWETFFQKHGIEPLVLWYEDFASDPQFAAQEVLRHLEIRLPQGFSFVQPRLARQSDQVSNRWVELYLAT